MSSAIVSFFAWDIFFSQTLNKFVHELSIYKAFDLCSSVCSDCSPKLQNCPGHLEPAGDPEASCPLPQAPSPGPGRACCLRTG